MDDVDVVFMDGADLDIEFVCERDVEMGRRVEGTFERVNLTIGCAGKFTGELITFDNNVDPFGLSYCEFNFHFVGFPGRAVSRSNNGLSTKDHIKPSHFYIKGDQINIKRNQIYIKTDQIYIKRERFNIKRDQFNVKR